MRSASILLLGLFALSGCSAAETSTASFGGASGSGAGSGGVGGSSGSGGFAGYAAGGVVGGAGGSAAAGGNGGASGGSAGAAGSSGSAGTTGVCVPMPLCDAPLPNVGPSRSWKHTGSILIAGTGFANHRGRDLLLTPVSPQWIIGKFAYGAIDKDLKDEEVDVWLNRDCGPTWEKLGTALTTEENEHVTVEGVVDSGGRIYFPIPAGKELGIGRHRARLVVAGDLTGADVFIEVLPPGVRFVVTDVDGTLTAEETEEYGALLSGSVSAARPDAAAVFTELAKKGYRPLYLTARPEFLVGRTREFVSVHGFPLGLVRTTTALGATGAAAVTFKKAELSEALARGALFDWGFGNTDSDASAYFSAGIQPNAQRVFVQYTDGAYGGRRIESYSELLPELAALPAVCP